MGTSLFFTFPGDVSAAYNVWVPVTHPVSCTACTAMHHQHLLACRAHTKYKSGSVEMSHQTCSLTFWRGFCSSEPAALLSSRRCHRERDRARYPEELASCSPPADGIQGLPSHRQPHPPSSHPSQARRRQGTSGCDSQILGREEEQSATQFLLTGTCTATFSSK